MNPIVRQLNFPAPCAGRVRRDRPSRAEATDDPAQLAGVGLAGVAGKDAIQLLREAVALHAVPDGLYREMVPAAEQRSWSEARIYDPSLYTSLINASPQEHLIITVAGGRGSTS
ncbi:MAG: hypothetical protein AB1445_04050 [Bacillota bacterium]